MVTKQHRRYHELRHKLLHELSDVSNTTPTDDQILKYSTTTNRWELGSDINDITDKSLGELQDVDIVSPSVTALT